MLWLHLPHVVLCAATPSTRLKLWESFFFFFNNIVLPLQNIEAVHTHKQFFTYSYKWCKTKLISSDRCQSSSGLWKSLEALIGCNQLHRQNYCSWYVCRARQGNLIHCWRPMTMKSSSMTHSSQLSLFSQLLLEMTELLGTCVAQGVCYTS